jgi:single-strand DNA-binding protein
VRFNIAVNRYVKDKDHPEADYFMIIAWEKTAEFICNHFGKGDAIIIEGNVKTGNYEDKEGVKRKSFDILARQVYFAEKKKKEDENGTAKENRKINFEDDDHPF